MAHLSYPVKMCDTFGKGNGSFNNPRGVAFYDDNQIICIADFHNSRIQV